MIAGMAGRDRALPEDLRSNLVIFRSNLTALRKVDKRIWQVVLLVEVPSSPCRRIEETLGFGTYNSKRGHGRGGSAPRRCATSPEVFDQKKLRGIKRDARFFSEAGIWLFYLERELRLRSCGSRKRLRRRIAFGVTSTSSSSSM